MVILFSNILDLSINFIVAVLLAFKYALPLLIFLNIFLKNRWSINKLLSLNLLENFQNLI